MAIKIIIGVVVIALSLTVAFVHQRILRILRDEGAPVDLIFKLNKLLKITEIIISVMAGVILFYVVFFA